MLDTDGSATADGAGKGGRTPARRPLVSAPTRERLAMAVFYGAAGGALFGGLIRWLYAVEWVEAFGWTAAVCAVLGFVLPDLTRSIRGEHPREKEAERKSEEAEQRYSATAEPDPGLAWEMARTRIVEYVAANQAQARGIFILTVAVMLLGFLLIAVGVAITFKGSPAPGTALSPEIISAGAGVISQFIGATLMQVYRSTLQQTREYVEVLERINAVGMSMSVLASIEGEPSTELADQTRSKLASEVLDMYAPRAAGSGG